MQAVARAKAQMLENEMREKFGHSAVAMARARTKLLYHSIPFQFSVAGLIMLAFAVDVLEASLLPPPQSVGADVFFWIDVSITGLFTMELLTNAFGILLCAYTLSPPLCISFSLFLLLFFLCLSVCLSVCLSGSLYQAKHACTPARGSRYRNSAVGQVAFRHRFLAGEWRKRPRSSY